MGVWGERLGSAGGPKPWMGARFANIDMVMFIGALAMAVAAGGLTAAAALGVAGR